MSTEKNIPKEEPKVDATRIVKIEPLADTVMQYAPNAEITEGEGHAGRGFYVYDSEYPEHGSSFLGDDESTIAAIVVPQPAVPETNMTNAAEARKVLKWFEVKHKEGHPECPACGHRVDAHKVAPNEPGKGVRVVCPAVPPPKQVTVDEAVVSKGGKPSTDFERELAAATGADAEAARKKQAEENFEKRPAGPVRDLLELKSLRPMKNNPRGDELGDVSALAKSIETNGFIGALFVREIIDGDSMHYEVWAGNRRLKAAKLAGLTEIPCDIYDITEGQALELNGAEQINRADLTPLQEAELCRRLKELQGYDDEQCAEKLGQSKSWVVKRIALCGLAPELKKGLAKGDISLTLANALAVLPTQQLQVKSFDAVIGYPTAEEQVANVRAKTCRPLADATWKLTDADLLPEAGACSTCPFNSATNAMPGLFDNAKAKPTCAKTECFEDKLAEAWLVKTSKLRSNGAKALSLAEGRKLFHGQGGPLPEASRYVEGNVVPKKDKKGRTWAELVAELPEEHRPQLHLAQDGAGKLRQLYVGDKVRDALLEHLKGMAWAKEAVEEATTSKADRSEAKSQAELADKHLVMDVRKLVTAQVLSTVAQKLVGGFTRPAALLLAELTSWEKDVTEFGTVLGRKLPKDWLQKGATQDELLAFIWWKRTSDHFGHPWDGFDDEFLALAKAHGIDVEAAVKAQLATARAEAKT